MEAALCPLAAQPASRQAGHEMLDRMRHASHPGAAALLARWAAVDARTRRPLVRRVLVVALVLVSAWVLAAAMREGVQYWGIGKIMKGAGLTIDERLVRGLNERDRFLLLGDVTRATKAEQIRVLWVAAPEDAGCFAAYAMKYLEAHNAYPPDFLATARRVDPANSWFTYLAAADLARNTVQKERQSSASRKAAEAPAWKILDEAKLKQALAMLRDAGKQEHYINRHKEFIAARIPLLPQPDLISRMVVVSYLNDHYPSDITLYSLANAIAAQAWLLGKAGDVNGFRQLLGDADAFMAACGQMPHPTLVGVLIFKQITTSCIRNLEAAAQQLGLAQEASRLNRIKGNFEQEAAAQNKRCEIQSNNGMEKRAGVFTTTIFRLRTQAQSPPPLTDAELQPGRMVEHLLVSRIALLAVWVLLGVGIMALAVYRFCLPAWLLALAQRMNALLLPVDWAWILGVGVVLPFGYVTGLMRCTPLGGQDWGLLKGGVALVVVADFLALALLMLVMPVLAARWRIGLRAAAFGVCSEPALGGRLAVAAAAAAVPLIDLSPLSASGLNPQLVLKLALLAPLLLLISASVVRALAVKFTRQFSRAVVALTLLPVYACGMLLIMLALPVYQAVQTGWERRDVMTELTADGITRYEGEVARQLLAEVRQVLELEAKP